MLFFSIGEDTFNSFFPSFIDFPHYRSKAEAVCLLNIPLPDVPLHRFLVTLALGAALKKRTFRTDGRIRLVLPIAFFRGGAIGEHLSFRTNIIVAFVIIDELCFLQVAFFSSRACIRKNGYDLIGKQESGNKGVLIGGICGNSQRFSNMSDDFLNQRYAAFVSIS